jgi:hypothetical protein
MLKIRNVADFPVMVSTSYMGGQGRPIYVKIPPGGHRLIGQEAVKKWPNGAKENLAESMQMGHLLVNEVTAVHSPKDDGHVLPEFIACNLGSAILNAAGQRWDGVSPLPPPPKIKGFVDVYNEHVLNAAVHTAPGTNVVTAAAPTDLATLIVYLTAVKAAFDAHLAAAPPHATADGKNVLGAAPTDLPTCIAFITQLYQKFNAHKNEYSANGAFLTPDAVIAYV